MNRKVIVFVSLLMLSLGLVCLGADETWQGNAAISLRGELDRGGLSAASNSFPQGTRISVTNLDNGKSVDVVIRKRIDGTSNVFLLLSENAGAQLGMKPYDIIRIKTEVIGLSTDLTGNNNDLAYNPDSDTNPAVGTPDMTTVTQNTPTPSPTPTIRPTPTPSPTPSVTPSPTPYNATNDIASRNPDKNRYTVPSTETEGDISTRIAPQHGEKESTAQVELKEARMPLLDKGEAVIIKRPKKEKDATRIASGEENLPRVSDKENAVTDAYTAVKPDRDEVIAILIEPKGALKKGEGTLSTVNRPSLDRETMEIALNDPVLSKTEKPFIYERHGLVPEGEQIALESHLPALSDKEIPELNSYVKKAQEEDRLALETHDLPDVRKGDKGDVNAIAKTDLEKDTASLDSHDLPDVRKGDRGDVNAIAKTDYEKETASLNSHDLPDVKKGDKADVNAIAKSDYEQEKVALKSHDLPNVKGTEKPEVTQNAKVEGKDKKTTDIALVPTDPNPPTKRKTEKTTVTPIDKTNVVKDGGTEYLRNFYYLQVGVYKNREAAERIIKANPKYPMIIVSGKVKNENVFKVVVGPLKRDESGTALYLFQANGYRDAFIRYIE
jgi:hypothetical protein